MALQVVMLKATEGDSKQTRIDFTVGVDEDISHVVDALVGGIENIIHQAFSLRVCTCVCM